jgi:hypothetical protein
VHPSSRISQQKLWLISTCDVFRDEEALYAFSSFFDELSIDTEFID